MKIVARVAFAVAGFALCAPGFAADPKAKPVEEAKPKSAPRQHFTLLCAAQLLRKTITVDVTGKAVDGVPAVFSETFITWTTGLAELPKKKGDPPPAPSGPVVHHELNRLEGSYRNWGEGESAERALTYGCEKAPPQKF